MLRVPIHHAGKANSVHVSAATKIDRLSANGVEPFQGVLPTTTTEARPDWPKVVGYACFHPRSSATPRTSAHLAQQ